MKIYKIATKYESHEIDTLTSVAIIIYTHTLSLQTNHKIRNWSYDEEEDFELDGTTVARTKDIKRNNSGKKTNV